MAQTFTASGLSLQKYEEVLAGVVSRMKAIYGEGVDLGATSPDRYIAEELARLRLETQEVLLKILNSFDPEQAQSALLDLRCSYNYIHRKKGSRAQVDIQFFTSSAITLIGQDTNPTSPFSLSDVEGNKWLLLATANIPAAPTGTPMVYRFIADSVGNRPIDANEVNVIDTPISGLISATNPAAVTETGSDIETDAELRLRRRRIMEPQFASTLQRMRIRIAELNGVNECSVLENNSDSTSVQGLPPHSFSVVVDGGSAAEIAAIINNERPPAVGMFGSVEVTVKEIDSNGVEYDFPVKFDYFEPQPFGIQITLTGSPVDVDDLNSFLTGNIALRINQSFTISDAIKLIHDYNPSLYVVDAQANGICQTHGGAITDILPPTLAKNRLVYDPTRSTFTVT